MRDAFRIVRLAPRHLLEIHVQPSQAVQLGRPGAFTAEEAETTVANGEGYAVIEERDGTERVAACYGLLETFAGRQAVAWAFFAEGLSRIHLAVTRHARAIGVASGLNRIEAVAMAPAGARTLADALARPTPEIRWARLVGLNPVLLLRHYGAAGDTMVFFERVAS